MVGSSRSTERAIAAVLFAALASCFCFTAPAHAAAAKSVILIQPPKGGITPKGDPLYNFTTDASLGVGYELWLGDYFTIMNVIGVNSTSLTTQPFFPNPLLPPDDIWSAQIANLAADAIWPGVDHETVDTANVKWILGTTAPPGTRITNDLGPNPLPLGQFTFQTYDSFSVLPADFSITYNYFVHAHDRFGNVIQETGTVTYTMAAVPEPASLALLGVGVALPVVVVRRRRRRASAG